MIGHRAFHAQLLGPISALRVCLGLSPWQPAMMGTSLSYRDGQNGH